ncbi:hypothetical protein [Namhaeicola litoreus]|uniref:Uncharacterized protein n=1 Tax=Namhaeicola litoreus TaxID=1052145 RepID=A0ABW3Y0M2_9FLAO
MRIFTFSFSMENINYIKHLNGVFYLFSKDARLNPSHISMYIALFRLWNINRFPKVFFIHRAEVMQLSRIGSQTTYHKCIRELDFWSYLKYLPSHNHFHGSRVKMFNFEEVENFGNDPDMAQNWTSDEHEADLMHAKNRTRAEQELVSLINKNKQIKQYKTEETAIPKNEEEVITFFKKENRPDIEAKKFFHYYKGIDWMIGKAKITNWKATAKTWMLRSSENETKKQLGQKLDNLHTSKKKNFNDPL